MKNYDIYDKMSESINAKLNESIKNTKVDNDNKIKENDLIECIVVDKLNENINDRGYHQVQTKYGNGFKYDSVEGFVNFCEDWDNGKINKDC